MSLPYPDERVLYIFLYQIRIRIHFSECITHHFPLTVSADSVHIKFGKKQTLCFSIGEQQRIIHAFIIVIPAYRTVGTGVAGVFAVGICHRNTAHILICSCRQCLQTRPHTYTIVRDENDFRTLEHQDSRTFGIFAVIANHDADFNAVKAAHLEFRSRFQYFFVGKITGMNL